MGIMYSGSSLGGVIWPILMSRLLNNPDIGFKWSLRIAGFINVPFPSQKTPDARFPLSSWQILLKKHDFLDEIQVHSSISNSSKIPPSPCSKLDSSWSS